MPSLFPQYEPDDAVAELRRTDQVLASMQQMLHCPRRGLCLMHEWFRRYGTSGSGCRCFERFQEHVMDYDFPLDVED